MDDRAVAVAVAVAVAEARAGLALAPLSGYRLASPGRTGLYLGHAGISEHVLQESVRRLAHMFRSWCPLPVAGADKLVKCIARVFTINYAY